MREANRLQWSHARPSDPTTVRRLRSARDYLAANLETADVRQAASLAGYSPFHFHRLFTGTFGETPHEFLTRLRIQRAKSLLIGNSLSVTDICFELGYESLGSFSSRFRSLTGLSPAQFRREAHRLYGGWQRAGFFYVPTCFLFPH